MPELLVTFLLLGVPLLAGVAGSVLVWSAYSDFRSRSAESDATSLARPRLPVFFAIAAVPFVFGLVVWLLVAGLEERYGILHGAFATVTFWMATAFAAVAVLVVASQTWVARSRLPEFISIQFGRVLPVIVIPNTSLIFAMLLSFLVVGRLSDLLAISSTLPEAAAGQVAAVFQVFAVAALANPIGIGLSLRVRDITTTQGFSRMLMFTDVASIASVIAFVWGFLQLGSV